MDCTQVEKMVPLYVEGDLTGADEERAVAAHLRSCGGCQRLADEYRESQSWLRSYAPPEFGAAFYDGIRGAVLEEINRNAARPSFFQLLIQPFKRRPVFAASFALLLIISSMVAFNIYRAKDGGEQSVRAVTGEEETPRAPVPAPQSSDTEADDVQRLVGPVRRASEQAARRAARTPLRGVRRETPTPVQKAPREQQFPETELAEASGAIHDREMLRIDLQTSDPNIRIIWFSPKGEGQLSTNPTNNR